MLNRYLSILRGINVSGQKKIIMADLKKHYQEQGFGNVITYIQSGNVVFDCNYDKPEEIKQSIESMIEEKYGFHVPVIIRSYNQLNNVVKEDPFKEIDKIENASKLHVYFLSQIPSTENIAQLKDFVKQQPEDVIVNNKHVYAYYPNGAGRSKLTTHVIERKLAVQATARNWKTTQKLLELLSLNNC